jgi:DNA-binding MarR family transcriptional regulator
LSFERRGGDRVDGDLALFREAEAITEHIRAVRLTLKRPIAESIARSGLTAPQVGALKALAGGGPQSLKDLCARLGLAHSTVSGIVDRLERRGLVRRETDPQDRRLTRIVVTDEVKTFIATGAELHHPAPLIEALRRATGEERSRILEGLTTLRHLLERGGAGRGHGAPGDPRRNEPSRSTTKAGKKKPRQFP